MRKDYDVLQLVKTILMKHLHLREDAIIIPEHEDFGFDMTIITPTHQIPVEVKSSYHHPLKMNGAWNPFFKTSGNGLFKTSDYTGPTTHAYIINADCKVGGSFVRLHHKCKWMKMVNTPHSMFIYIAEDGLCIWNHTMLNDAFLGYTTIKCRHTSQFNDRSMNEEYKSIISLDKAVYVPLTEKERGQFRKIVS